MRRNKIIALALSALLLSGGCAFAEGTPLPEGGNTGAAAAVPASGRSENLEKSAGHHVSDISRDIASQGMEKVSELPTAEMSGSIMGRIDLPKKMHYEPFSFLPVSMDHYGGLLTIEDKKFTGSAIVAGASFKGKASDEYFGGMFLPHGYTQEAAGKMLHFNMGLLKIESALNEIFLNTMKEVRKETKETIPYNLIILDMMHVEQLHKVKDKPKTYSFSLRPAFAADGFAVPLFVRGFASKVDDTYRFLLFTTFDSQKDLFSFAGLKLINEPFIEK